MMLLMLKSCGSCSTCEQTVWNRNALDAEVIWANRLQKKNALPISIFLRFASQTVSPGHFQAVYLQVYYGLFTRSIPWPVSWGSWLLLDEFLLGGQQHSDTYKECHLSTPCTVVQPVRSWAFPVFETLNHQDSCHYHHILVHLQSVS
jgi:hypothetical protein